MQVILIGDETIHKVILPQVPSGTYMLDGKSTDTIKTIKIEAQDGKWQVESDEDARIINPECMSVIDDKIRIKKSEKQFISRINLKEYSIYAIKFSNSKKIYFLYCLPVYEDNWISLKATHSNEITIGRDKSNKIIYENDLVSSKHARISLNNGRWMLENYDKNYGTFVNNNRIFKETKFLNTGDVIFIMGLKIILMENSIFINNPQNKVKYDKKVLMLEKKQENVILQKNDDSNDELYSPIDYFYRSPRITDKIDEKEIQIEAPPTKLDNSQMPTYLMIGSSLSMGVMTLITVVSTISGIANGTSTLLDSILSLLSAVTMVISMLLIPVLIRRWEKKKAKEYEEKRQKIYKEYINKKSKEIETVKERQRKILFENYATPEECTKIILDKQTRLWERTADADDFLTVNLGIGDIPFEVQISYPEEKGISMDDKDNLEEMLDDFTKEIGTLKNVPVTVSLAKENIIALVDKDDENIRRFMQNIFVQLMAFQSYIDLKFVFLLDEDSEKKWEYVKLFPYVWNNSKDFRFFEDNYDGMEEISRYLEEEFSKRLDEEDDESRGITPHYLIITDNYRKIENLKVISNIMKLQKNLGFSLLCIANNLQEVPNKCKTFITLEDKVGKIFSKELSKNSQKEFVFSKENTYFFDKISKQVSNIPVKYEVSERNSLPEYYTFLEMYKVGLIEQLNILDRWNNNDATLSLAAPIGVKPSGKLINLDLHEKYHGPHGLIAGSTGSGKSEFIITFILSLAVNYHPDDVTFILIDYKGGGLTGAFQKQDVKLPHLVGTITNIDKEGIKRSLVSIKSELRRRQIWFNEAREMTDEGTIDIYKYQKLYHNGVVKRPIPHLLIICDEFAELKQQQPEFMEELVSVSRIGRSLGVHLILATQKPSGIVDDQMRSNSKFAICLKVQDTGDSSEVIEKPDAAYIKQSGRFYMKVGKDDYFEIGQSGWSGAPYFPSDTSQKKKDESIKFISNIGTVIKQVNDYGKKVVNASSGEQLTNIVRHMHEIALRENIKTEQLWLDDIPEKIYIKDVKDKYKFKTEENKISLTIGEYDDPSNQKQGIVSLDLIKDGSIAIYGSADSGKETLMSTMVYDMITTYSSDDLWIYILDFGTETLKIFNSAPHVGEVIFLNNTEKINRFFKRLKDVVKERKQILSEYNGDYNFYKKTCEKKMPLITILINGYENCPDIFIEQYDDMLLTLTREGAKTGVVFIISVTASNDLRYRMAQNFKQKIALSLNDSSDYGNIFDNVRNMTPAHRFGRGLVNLGDNVFEFQTAKSCEPKDYNVFIKSEIEKTKQTNKTTAEKIPILPEKVKMESLRNSIVDLSRLPIGLRKKDIKIETFDFKNNFVNIIAANDPDEAMQFGINILEEIKLLKNIDIIILDPERRILVKKSELEENYKKLLSKIEEGVEEIEETVCIIFGIDRFTNFLEEYKEDLNNKSAEDDKNDDDDDDYDDDDEIEGKEKFAEIVKKCEKTEKFTFIIIDSASKIKEHSYDDWYEKNVIWVGDGIDDQYLLDLNASRKEIVNNCGCSFGYINNKNKTIMIKLLEMKEKKEDEDE